MSSLRKAVSIMRCFKTDATRLSVTDVARQLDLPKSSVSRLMSEMLDCGLLEREPASRRYSPGFMLFQLGSLYQQNLNLFDLVDDTVKRLVGETGHTGYIGVLQGGDMVALRMHHGRDPVRYILEAGRRSPAYVLSLGKALLARRSDDEVRGLYRDPLDHSFPQCPASLEHLIAELRTARTRGWAEADVGSIPGAKGIGVAVGSALRDQAIGYSLSYMAAAMDDRAVKDLTQTIARSALEIGQKTGDPHWCFRG